MAQGEAVPSSHEASTQGRSDTEQVAGLCPPRALREAGVSDDGGAGGGTRGGGSVGGKGGGGGDGDGPPLMSGRSCRGCVFFTRGMQEAGRDPMCVGLVSAEVVPVGMFGQPRQQRQSQPPTAATHHHHHHHHHHHQQQQQQQQQQAASYERQQKILEDFRYACIGYSLYPTRGTPLASSGPGHPPSPPSDKESVPGVEFSAAERANKLGQGLGVTPVGSGVIEGSHPLPLGGLRAAGAGAGTGGEAGPGGGASTGEGVLWWMNMSNFTNSSISSSNDSSSRDNGAGSTSSSSGTREGLPSGGTHAKKPAMPPPSLPVCVGIEILAGTKAERNEQAHTRSQDAHRQHQQQPEHQHVPQETQEAHPVPTTTPESPRQPWTRPPVANPDPTPGGMTSEEFKRRYIRAAKLIAKKCVSNFEKLKSSVRSTVQGIFRGDK